MVKSPRSGKMKKQYIVAGNRSSYTKHSSNAVPAMTGSQLHAASESQINDALALRRATLANKVPYCTNMSTALACLEAIKSLKRKKLVVTSLQDI